MIRVLLVDDQTLVRHGIRSPLELSPDIDVVGEAEDGEVALQRIAELDPDVVLLDLRMPRLDGIGVLRALHRVEGAPPMLILATFDDDAFVLEGLRAGAKAYLLDDVSLEQLVAAVHALHQGRSPEQAALTERVLRHLPRPGGAAVSGLGGAAVSGLGGTEQLTERETERLRLMAGGYSNREIARGLDLSEGTVKNHVSSILSKMGVRDRTRAVL